jgi:hypothetical protein
MNAALFVSAVNISSQCLYPFANTANSVTVLMRPTTAHGLLSSIQITLYVFTNGNTDYTRRRSDRVSHESTVEVIH